MAKNTSASWVRDRYDAGMKQIQVELYNYWLNYAFHAGHQWLYWDRLNNRVDQLPEDPDRIRMTVNRIKADTRIIISNYTQRELVFEVHPSGFDDLSITSARLGSGILRDLHQAHSWEVLREQLGIATLKGGTAAVCLDWDEQAEESVETVLSIAQFVVEPGTRDAERARWWVKCVTMPPAEAQAVFGLKDEPPADALPGMASFSRKVLTSGGTGDVPLTLVLTYYERPNYLCPEGKVAIEVDGKIIFEGTWPFPWRDRLNLWIMRETMIEDQWAGGTVMTDARKIQTGINLAWSNYMEHLRDAGNARLLVPSSAADIVKQVTDTPGEMIEYPDGVQPPQYLSPPQLTSWLQSMAANLKMELDDIMGVHDVSRGMAPANIESGYGVSILAEKDSSPIGKLIKESARVFTGLSRAVLALYAVEATKERETAVVSSAGPERFKWTGKDLAGQFDVVVPLDAVMPRSQAAQQALADRMVQMGLIQSPAQYIRFAQVPGQEYLIDAVMPDVSKARRENHSMGLGRPEIPAPFDDHGIHIQEHNDFRKSERYETMDDETKAIIDDHIKAHARFAEEAVGRARKQEAMDPALAMAPNPEGAGPELPPLPVPPEQGAAGIPLGEEAVPLPDELMVPGAEGELDAAVIADQAMEALDLEM